MMKWSVGTKIASGFALMVLILVIVGIVVFASTNALIDSSRARQRAYEALRGISETFSLVKDVEIGARSYALNGQPESLQPYRAALEQIAAHVRDARNWMKNNSQQQQLDRLERLIQQRIAKADEIIRARDTHGLQGAADLVNSGAMDDIRSLIQEIEQQENTALETYVEATIAQADSALKTILLGTIAAAVLSTLVAFLITRNISIPLQQLTRVAEQIALVKRVAHRAMSSRRRKRIVHRLRDFQQAGGAP